MEQNKNERRFYAWEKAALISLCLALCLSVWAQGRQEDISGGLIRLHVLAVSDAPEEQEIKLRVRDAVLDYLRPEMEGIDDARQARALLQRDLEGVARAAETAAEGRSVRVSLGREDYPTRSYGKLTLPAGRYESLRIVLGEGEGHNWWCVVFPPLCLAAAEGDSAESAMASDLPTETETCGYTLRFRLVELWGEVMNALYG